MSANPLPTAARARELFDYDETDGSLRWRISQSSRARIGAMAGSVRKDGRRIVTIDGVQYLAARVVWLLVKGTWPAFEIDHIDCDTRNDRIANLRDVPTQINSQNKRRHRSDKRFGSSLGAYPAGRRWRAQIVVGGKAKHLGCFDTEKEAFEAYLVAKRRMHAGCTI